MILYLLMNATIISPSIYISGCWHLSIQFYKPLMAELMLSRKVIVDAKKSYIFIIIFLKKYEKSLDAGIHWYQRQCYNAIISCIHM